MTQQCLWYDPKFVNPALHLHLGKTPFYAGQMLASHVSPQVWRATGKTGGRARVSVHHRQKGQTAADTLPFCRAEQSRAGRQAGRQAGVRLDPAVLGVLIPAYKQISLETFFASECLCWDEHVAQGMGVLTEHSQE